MGAESFFITLLADNVEKVQDKYEIKYIGQTSITDQQFINFIKNHHNKIIEEKSYDSIWYSINDIIKLTLILNDNYLQGFSLEACFSNYNESLEKCLNIIYKVNNELIKLKAVQPIQISHDSLKSKSLIEEIKKINASRFKAFIDTFGDVHFSSLPDNDFYEKLTLLK